jgi:hypothetical protein
MSSKPITNRVSRVATMVALLCALGHQAAAQAVTGQHFFVNGVIPAGAYNTQIPIGTVPTGKQFVIQSISYYRYGAVSGSIGQMFFSPGSTQSTISYTALPEAVADGSLFPSATLTGTFYAWSGQKLFANVYTSQPSTGETDVITVSGYLVTE